MKNSKIYHISTIISVVLGLVFVFHSTSLHAQFRTDVDESGKELPKAACPLGESVTQYWECGVKLTARNAPVTGATATVPVPVSCPEQQVKIAEERHSPYAKVDYKKQAGGCRLMVISIPSLPAGETAEVITRFECTSSTQLKPENVESYQKPDVKKLPKSFGRYLKPSDKIESRDKSIVKLSKEIGTDAESAWAEVEAVYDWVQANIEYKNGKLKGALAALKDGTGDCEELSSLFIAICRAKGIPARTVWVPEHCYAEFYLVDEDGKGFWFPCQPAGDKAFGEMPFQYVILQKGDSFQLPGERKPVRYLPQQIKAKAKVPPSYQMVGELVQPQE